VVDSSGNPIKGLTEKDFEILEDGKRQSLTCFQERDVERLEETMTLEDRLEIRAKIPPRRFVLFLDLFNTSPPEYLRVRPKIDEFLNQLKGRNWKVMLTALTKKGRLGVIAPFTSDVSTIRAQMLKAPANGMRDARTRNNLRNIRFLLEEALERGDREGTILRRAYQMAQSYSKEEEEMSELSVEALESFAAHLIKQRSNEEHTVILYVSGGFNAEPGRQYFEIINDFFEKLGEKLDLVEFATRFPRSLPETKFDIRRMVKNSVGKLNKQNITLYTINTRGMYDAGDNIDLSKSALVQFTNTYLQDYQESLAQIAEETGGAFFQNSQNFKKGFDLILTDLSHQYELCYRSTAEKMSAKYHKIEVRTSRKGARVRHRKGYWD
jgi:VWFA-related protein